MASIIWEAESVEIHVVLDEGAVAPCYATEGSAGLDLCSSESVTLNPMERKCIATGVRVAIPRGYEGQVRPRSGLALRHGLGMVNSVGTIDSDYRGEIGVLLINFGTDPVQILAGDRIAQLVICPIAHVRVISDGATLSETSRGEGGFGSTGTR